MGVLESGIWVVAGPKAPCLGASGAIMGIIGAFLLLYPLNDVSVGYMFTFFYSGVYALSAMWVIAVYIAFDIWGLIRGGNSGFGLGRKGVSIAVNSPATWRRKRLAAIFCCVRRHANDG